MFNRPKWAHKYYVEHCAAMIEYGRDWYQRNSKKRCKQTLNYQRKHPERRAFYAMRRRCADSKTAQFKDYGGRGIRVKYKSFDDFIADVGPRPSKYHSIDRIDVNGHYAPGNCRWATRMQQAHNKRKPCKKI